MNTYQSAAIAMRIRQLDRQLAEQQLLIKQHTDLLENASESAHKIEHEIAMLKGEVLPIEGDERIVRKRRGRPPKQNPEIILET